MKDRILLIQPASAPSGSSHNQRLEDVVSFSLDAHEYTVASTLDELVDELKPETRPRFILWAVDIGVTGINLELYRMLDHIRCHDTILEGTIGGIIIDGKSRNYTKSVGRSVVLACNMAGAAFPGRCLVEGHSNLSNYTIQARNLDTDLMGAYRLAGRGLIDEMHLYDTKHSRKKYPKLLVIHASDSRTSNTLALWELVKSHLDGCDFREISLRNGEIMDCRGCSYEVCRYFSSSGKCFYGGTITELVYPGLLECDALVMLCPNYNDAISANLAAFVNRMTALFVSNRFYDKSLFSIIVSGYSGGEIIAEQLVSGLCMNKTLSLPPRFALIETANQPGEILNLDGIESRAKEFADRILSAIHS